ncbi:MAG TPA: dTMP kinase [Candidatus Wujingus californicus]|uniref:dTMP kinase n=1 Tax=Candidatus Wujingus californicus TaxID=3367618 RepID=UPI001D7D393E|nr:dTMP kinase [Planctomycetota bacterium]MDO8130380.1 dTMP kinase [Candidatus Brocadiales bacterium]
MQGKLIVITGIDGSGKTVQTKLIYERLLREKYAVVTTDFPQYGKTFFAEMVIKYLKGEYGSADSVSPYLAALLYAGDRWEAKEQINNWLREGKIIISNRYVCDNMAHQGGKIHAPEEKDKFIQWLDKLEHHIFGIPRPNLNILLHVPVEIAYKLIEKKAPRAYLAGEKKDVHEKDINHLECAQQSFWEIAKTQRDWLIINCTENGVLLPEKVISDKIYLTVQKLLGK